MKMLAAGLLLCATAVTAHGQTSAGTVLLGGSVGYSHTKEETTGTYQSFNRMEQGFRLAPTVGYFLSDQLAIGVTGSYSRTKQKNSTSTYYPGTIPGQQYSSTSKGSTEAIGPFVRYYKTLGEKVALFGQVFGGYQAGRSTGKADNSDESGRQTYKGFEATLTPGAVWFPTTKLGLELTIGNLGYNYNKQTTETTGRQTVQRQETKFSNYGAYFGLQSLNVGASFYL